MRGASRDSEKNATNVVALATALSPVNRETELLDAIMQAIRDSMLRDEHLIAAARFVALPRHVLVTGLNARTRMRRLSTCGNPPLKAS